MKGSWCVVLVVALAGCKGEEVNANVSCETTVEPAVECTVTQTKGKTAVQVCWDFAATCANGAAVTAPRSCAVVKDGGSTKHKIPGDQLAGLDKCAGDKPPTAAVTNLALTEAK